MISLRQKQNGLSLIELMIAIGLSMILTLGVIQIFSSSKQTSRVQDSLARLQENARFALDILTHDIRMAGQLGCNGSSSVSYAGELANHGASIMGYEFADLPAGTSAADSALVVNNDKPDRDSIVAATDTIIILSASPNPIRVSSNDTITTITVPDAGDIANIDVGDPLLLSDCENADLIIVDAIAGNTITSIFSKVYGDFSQLATLNYNAYYIREANNQNNLYRSSVNGRTNVASVDSDPLLESVENMQILYGEDINRDGTAIRYVPADTAGLDWGKVSSVRIHLLLATQENNLAREPQSYWFAGRLIPPAAGSTDRRLFRSFTTTIKLRNQGLDV